MTNHDDVPGQFPALVWAIIFTILLVAGRKGDLRLAGTARAVASPDAAGVTPEVPTPKKLGVITTWTRRHGRTDHNQPHRGDHRRGRDVVEVIFYSWRHTTPEHYGNVRPAAPVKSQQNQRTPRFRTDRAVC